MSSCLRWSISGRAVSTARSTTPPQGDPFLVKLNPAGGDAGDFQQVIDEACQLPHLTLDDAAGLLLDQVLVALRGGGGARR